MKKKTKDKYRKYFDLEYLKTLSTPELKFLMIFVKDTSSIKEVLQKRNTEKISNH